MDLMRRLQDEGAYRSTWGKARALVREGAVLECDAHTGILQGAVMLSGRVRASTPGLSYHATCELSLAEQDVIDYSCTCPVGGTGGMCKHAMALALSYLESAETTDGPAAGAGTAGGPYENASVGAGAARGHEAFAKASRDSMALRSHGSAATPSRVWSASTRSYERPMQTAYVAPTSAQLSNLISKAVERRAEQALRPRQASPAVATPKSEPVELLPTLAPAGDNAFGEPSARPWLLKLRVRRGDVSYLVKNMGELARCYQGRREHAYGKRLSFVHVPEAFDERSRAILDLVTRVAQSQQALYLSRWNYSGAGRGSDVKELPLSQSDVVALLDVLQGSELTYEPGGFPPARPRSLAVTTGEPDIQARMAASPSGGYDLVLPRELVSFSAGGTLYLLDETRALRCPDAYAHASASLLVGLLPATRPLHVAEADLPEFCRSVLPALAQATTLDVPAELYALTPPEPTFSFDIGLEDGEVTCRATVSYDGTELGLYEPRRTGQPPRDMAAEYHAQDVLERYFHGTAGDLHFDEGDDELLFDLLTEGLGELGELGEVRLSERLRAVEVRDAPQLRVRATVRSGLLDMAVDASGLSARDLKDYLASYRRHQRFVRLSDGDIVRIGDDVRTLEGLSEGLNLDLAQLVGGVEGLPEGLALFVDGLLRKRDRAASRVALERDASFRALVRELDTFSEAAIEMPPSLEGVLRPYQVEGVRWLGTLERFGLGGILADDMGLGKTLQVIALILAGKEGALSCGGTVVASAASPAGAEGASATGTGAASAATSAGASAPGHRTTLVVAPASLVYNWTSELAKFAPSLTVAAVVGAKGARERLIAAADGTDVLVTSYDLMKRDVRAYAARHFRRVVLDEAQYIKNPGTQAAKAAKCLPADARVALTGTPIENRLSELWSIFDFLMPGVLGSREAFAKRFEGPVEHGDAEATRALRCLVGPFILRRLKEDVLADLPEKTEGVVMAQMGAEQEKLYLANQDRLALQVQHQLPEEFKRERLKVLAELTKLRQICCDPRLCFDNYAGGSAKLDACIELLRGAVDGGHRVLVFSQFTSMLGLLARRLDAERLGFQTLTGATSKEERARLVAEFQAGKAPVFLISLKAGGVGLNLTAADTVIHYDPWWNVAAQDQATDRAHRIGQRRSVNVVKLIVKGTIEERIVQMQARKRDLADAVLGGSGLASAQITKDDILALLGASGT